MFNKPRKPLTFQMKGVRILNQKEAQPAALVSDDTDPSLNLSGSYVGLDYPRSLKRPIALARQIHNRGGRPTITIIDMAKD